VGRVKLKLLKMKKIMFTAFAVGLCLTAKVMAQVPSYVPTNGLVGYWPFNGNANDESGNGNNGTVNGATLTTDRFGNVNTSYSFNGSSNWIEISHNSNFDFETPNSITISTWIKTSMTSGAVFVQKQSGVGNTQNGVNCGILNLNGSLCGVSKKTNGIQSLIASPATVSNNNSWHHFVYCFSGGYAKTYLDGVLISSQTDAGSIVGNSTTNLIFGYGLPLNNFFYNGRLDDIGIWNRALTAQEITALYSGCGNEITTQPTNSINTLGANAQFSLNAVAGSTYQWQSNPLNTGWLNLTNNSTYSGATTNTLTVSNTTISNHHQPFRAIVNAGGCVDTSDVAQIIIGDTCLTTVTDTLIINATLSLPAPNNENTILIYPNPASDHITIDNGNYTAMAGYTIKIENNAGQQVFQSLINQAQFYVDLSTWSGNGLYFVHLIDAQGNTVTVRKIVLQ
jgi:hypothetical protein